MPFWDASIQGCLCLSRIQGFRDVYAFVGYKDLVLFMPF